MNSSILEPLKSNCFHLKKHTKNKLSLTSRAAFAIHKSIQCSNIKTDPLHHQMFRAHIPLPLDLAFFLLNVGVDDNHYNTLRILIFEFTYRFVHRKTKFLVRYRKERQPFHHFLYHGHLDFFFRSILISRRTFIQKALVYARNTA